MNNHTVGPRPATRSDKGNGADDPRHGFSRTLDEAKADIDEQIEEMADV